MDARSVRSVRSAQSQRSLPEDQRRLKTHAQSIRMDAMDHPRRQKSGYIDSPGRKESGFVDSPRRIESGFMESSRRKEGGLKTKETAEVHIVQKSLPAGDARSANRLNRGEALFDMLIAILPLYFVAFAFLAYSQDGTLASNPLDQTIFKMAAFNPTAFPILFTLICARFLKAIANYKLERGVTVATIQHLLGSRSLVTSFLTPLKLHNFSITAIVVIICWTLNPIGGQSSLRVATRASNYTTVATNFDYLDLNTSPFALLNAPNRLAPINAAFNAALLSPATSKNGTQDLFGNVQIPMLEVLKNVQKADSDGWYRTGQLAQTDATNAASLEEFLGIPNDADANTDVLDTVYISLTGIPYLRNSSTSSSAVQGGDSAANQHDSLDRLESMLFESHSNVKNVESRFNVETSYFALGCSVAQDGKTKNDDEFPRDINTKTGVVSNNYQFAIMYDFNHTINSTAPRQIELTSWNGHASKADGEISKATCQLTTTYVEASVYCSQANNCSVQAVRESLLDHPKPALSQLDGIAPSWNATSNVTQAQRHAIPELFFSAFINATGNLTQDSYGLSPIECYLLDPANPYQCSIAGRGQYALYNIGDDLISQRFTQLLNTYWMDNVAQYSVTGNFTPDNIFEQSTTATASGQIRIETNVLRCHIPFMIILVAVSIALFIVGMATAYLDAKRRCPDLLDDFVNHLRYNPYVHVEHGSTMEDGYARSKRFRNTTVQIGDVRPDDPVGYVAIGTPTWKQPMRMLQHDRKYH